jgi:hypothetical protein|tara:strand:+ start:32 stop:457 length:426 start_codon:yes stop_codon:yes gene_type:complete
MYKENPKTDQLNLDFNILVCTILTLNPYDKAFRYLTITKGRKRDKYKAFYSKTNDFELVYSVLNKRTIRELAYILTQPLTGIKQDKSLIGVPEKLLKTYLQKYNYNFNNYFLQEQVINGQKLTPKELNQGAIRALFFIIGI